MSTKKWLILIAVGMALCVTIPAIVLIAWFFGLGNFQAGPWLPVYTINQTNSTHAGYLRTTVTSGTLAYASDFEEYALEVQNREPTNAIGRGPVGGKMVFTIDGQKATDYIAVDEGSEMPAYAVFRNTQLPPFDWRQLAFQSMVYAGPISQKAGPRVTDPALIEDVVSTLRQGTPIPPTALSAGSAHNLYALWLYSEQLPGLVFSPMVYADTAGPVYLSANVVMVSGNSNQWTEARWVPAGPLFTKWVRGP